MRCLRILLLLFMVTFGGGYVVAQQQSQSNPQALAIAGRAMTAMGGALLSPAHSDSLASGTLTMNLSGVSPMAIVLKSKGLTETRVELQMPTGTNVRIVNNGRGIIQRPDGSIRQLSMNNTVAEHVDYIPLLSLLAEYLNPAARVDLVSTVGTNGTADDVIAISLGQSSDPQQAAMLQQMTRRLFYINRLYGIVDKVEYTSYSEDANSARMKTQEVFGDYRNVGGVAVPFHCAT